LDFGHLSLSCKPKDDLDEHWALQQASNDDDKASLLKSIIKGSYWKFNIDLKEVQLFLARDESEWNAFKAMSSCVTPNHILKPLDLFLNLYKCAYDDDANLPSMKIASELPIIDICLTDVKLENFLQILLSVGEANKRHANKDRGAADEPQVLYFDENETQNNGVFKDLIKNMDDTQSKGLSSN
jgi:hypothetical protein